MILELLTDPAGACSSRIDLVMGTPYTSDLLYDDLFRQLATEHGNFKYHTAISRETHASGAKGLYVDGLMEQKIDYFAETLRSPRTIVYVCGLEGMRYGLFKALIKHELADGYLNVDTSVHELPVAQWSNKVLKKAAKPTSRCMLEVY